MYIYIARKYSSINHITEKYRNVTFISRALLSLKRKTRRSYKSTLLYFYYILTIFFHITLAAYFSYSIFRRGNIMESPYRAFKESWRKQENDTFANAARLFLRARCILPW